MNGAVRVRGGKKLIGGVFPIPNKNSLMPVFPAAILCKGVTRYKNVPKTTDVAKHIKILRDLGAKINDSDYSDVSVDCSDVKNYSIISPEAKLYRSSIMYVGPLLARFGKATVPLPGGCSLGARSISSHINVFRELGAMVTFVDDYVEFVMPQASKTAEIWLLEASVTATENIFLILRIKITCGKISSMFSFCYTFIF